MKIPKLLLKLKSSYIYWKLERYTDIERNYPVIANSAIALQPELYETISISTACLYYFNSPTPTLLDLIEVLDTTINELKNNTVATRALLVRSAPVTIESFLKDQKSRYIDAPRALAIFKSLTLEYHLLYQKLSTFKIGVEGYNNRGLSVFTQNLITLTDAIRNYSHEQK